MARSRRMKMPSITGLTSHAISPSIADTTSASSPPVTSQPQYGRT